MPPPGMEMGQFPVAAGFTWGSMIKDNANHNQTNNRFYFVLPIDYL